MSDPGWKSVPPPDLQRKIQQFVYMKYGWPPESEASEWVRLRALRETEEKLHQLEKHEDEWVRLAIAITKRRAQDWMRRVGRRGSHTIALPEIAIVPGLSEEERREILRVVRARIEKITRADTRERELWDHFERLILTGSGRPTLRQLSRQIWPEHETNKAAQVLARLMPEITWALWEEGLVSHPPDHDSDEPRQ